MACSFSAVNGFIRAAFIHVAIQRCFSRAAKKKNLTKLLVWQLSYTADMENSVKGVSASSFSSFLSPILCRGTLHALWVVHLDQNKPRNASDSERNCMFAHMSVCYYDNQRPWTKTGLGSRK